MPSQTEASSSQGGGSSSRPTRTRKQVITKHDNSEESDGGDASDDALTQGSRKRKSTASQGKARVAPTRRKSAGGWGTVFDLSQCAAVGGESEDECTMSFSVGDPEKREHAIEIVIEDSHEKITANVSEEVKAGLVKSMARMLLMKGGRQETITRTMCTDLVKAAGSQAKLSKAVIPEANKLLENTFGFKLLASKDSKDKFYLLNVLHKAGHRKDVLRASNSQGSAWHGYIMFVLSLVFCEPGRSITENKLVSGLHKLHSAFPDVDEWTRNAGKKGSKGSGDILLDGAGTARELLDNAVKQTYILKEEVPNTGDHDETAFKYSWGPRAYLEVGRHQMIKFLCETLGRPVDQTLLAQLSDNEEEEEENAEG